MTFQKLIATGVAALLTLSSGVPSAFAGDPHEQVQPGGKTDKDQNLTEIKKTISSTNKKTPVTVTLLDTTKLKGRVSQVTDKRFTLVEEKGTNIRDISYEEIASVSRQVSKKVIFGVVAGIAGVITYAVLRNSIGG